MTKFCKKQKKLKYCLPITATVSVTKQPEKPPITAKPPTRRKNTEKKERPADLKLWNSKNPVKLTVKPDFIYKNNNNININIYIHIHVIYFM